MRSAYCCARLSHRVGLVLLVVSLSERGDSSDSRGSFLQTRRWQRVTVPSAVVRYCHERARDNDKLSRRDPRATLRAWSHCEGAYRRVHPAAQVL